MAVQLLYQVFFRTRRGRFSDILVDIEGCAYTFLAVVLYSFDGLQSGRAQTSSFSMPLELGEIDLESSQVAISSKKQSNTISPPLSLFLHVFSM